LERELFVILTPKAPTVSGKLAGMSKSVPAH
jgi:hypothetical protein